MSTLSAANLDSALLSLYRAKGSGSINSMIYAITGAWNADTVTWKTMPTKQSQAISTVKVPSTLKVWVSFNVTSAIKNMLSGSLPNNGFMITLEENSGVEVIYTSSEGAAVADRPKLTLFYNSTGVQNTAKRRHEHILIGTNGSYLTISNPLAQSATFRLFTLQGRSVCRETAVEGGATAKIPFSPGKGTFIVKVKSSSSLHVRKVVIR